MPALVQSEFAWWATALAADPPPDPALAPRADAKGLQLLASVLRWSPSRLSIDLGDSPAGQLWARLGLNDPADAEPVLHDGRLVGLRGAAE